MTHRNEDASSGTYDGWIPHQLRQISAKQRQLSTLQEKRAALERALDFAIKYKQINDIYVAPSGFPISRMWDKMLAELDRAAREYLDACDACEDVGK